MAFLEETAWQLGRYPNVYVNLEVTSAYAATRPAAFGHALGMMASIGGAGAPERVSWGTGGVGCHPQTPLESFGGGFAFPDAVMARGGIAANTAGEKQTKLVHKDRKRVGQGKDEEKHGSIR